MTKKNLFLFYFYSVLTDVIYTTLYVLIKTDASYCRSVARERSVCILWPTIQQYLCRREFCRTCLPVVLLTVLSESTSYERLISFRLTKTDLYVVHNYCNIRAFLKQ